MRTELVGRRGLPGSSSLIATADKLPGGHMNIKVIARAIALAAIATALAPFSSGVQASDVPEACKDRSNTFARFVQPASGQATVNAGPAGTLVVNSGAGAPSATLSLTGSMDVVIDYGCLQTMGLVVTKDDPAGGAPTVVHTASWNLKCETDQKTEAVQIGLDGGHYRFALSGTSCSGVGFKHTPEGGLVGDPPVV